MIDFKISNKEKFRYIFEIIDNFSEHLWCISFKNKKAQTITQIFSKFLSISKRSPPKIDSDRGAEFLNCDFQNLVKGKHIQLFSRFTDKAPSIAERVLRTIRILLKKPVFEKGNADWIYEIPSVTKQYKNTIHG